MGSSQFLLLKSVFFLYFTLLSLGSWAIPSLPVMDTKKEVYESRVKDLKASKESLVSYFSKLDKSKANFNNSVANLNDQFYEFNNTIQKWTTSSYLHPSKPVRQLAVEKTKVVQELLEELTSSVKIYETLEYMSRSPVGVVGEDFRLLTNYINLFADSGIGLSGSDKQDYLRITGLIRKNEMQFRKTVFEKNESLRFTRAELVGVSESSLSRFKQDPQVPSVYIVDITGSSAYQDILRQCEVEATRRTVFQAVNSLYEETNSALFLKTVRLRYQLAKLLGYESWGAYKLRGTMAQNPNNVISFLNSVKPIIKEKAQQEIEELTQRKILHTGDRNSVLKPWDYTFFAAKEDSQEDFKLNEFFEYKNTFAEMISIFSELFAVDIREVKDPDVWDKEVKLYVLIDIATGEDLGAVYVDMFPREGKFRGCGIHSLQIGRKFPKKTVSAEVLMCDLPQPKKNEPILLGLNDVESLFHEIGHVLHSALAGSKYAEFRVSGSPRDFSEGPSQILENWVYEDEILNRIARHYKDPSRKIPRAVLDKIRRGRKLSKGRRNALRFVYAQFDIDVHLDNETIIDRPYEHFRNLYTEMYMDPIVPINRVTSLLHIMYDYDSQIYGYMWSDAFGKDMYTVFTENPDGVLDPKLGMRLRREVYEKGSLIPASKIVENFLGRPWNSDAYVESLR